MFYRGNLLGALILNRVSRIHRANSHDFFLIEQKNSSLVSRIWTILSRFGGNFLLMSAFRWGQILSLSPSATRAEAATEENKGEASLLPFKAQGNVAVSLCSLLISIRQKKKNYNNLVLTKDI